MARKSSSTAVQEDLYPLPSEVSQHRAPEREPFDDARLVDLEAEQESPFLRGQKRVSVRRGSLPQKTANRLMWVAAALVVLAILGAAGLGLYRYGKHSWRFRIDSSDQIEVTGAEHVAHAQIMEVMGGDIGRNIFFVPLAQRKQQLEQIPWVESASVMRFVPNRLRIEIHERTPVAFARIGAHISLIDAGGTLMELAPGGKHKYSFAVIAGMNAGEPLSTRAGRMKNYNELVRELDSGGARYSQELSEVDLSDSEDVKVLAADSNGEVLVHLGSGNYLQRYRTYVTHVQQWRQQFDKLESVDLRYDGQIIVNPDLEGMARQPALTPAAAKMAMAAGVKTAAIVNYEKYVTQPVPATPAKKEAKPKAKVRAKVAVHHAQAKPAPAKHASAKPASFKPFPAKPAPVKPAPVNRAPANHAALKPREKTATVAVAKNRAAPHPVASTSSARQKKPSAAIRKETPQN
ncbi:MAG TPA: FtsQ-type POTRA domain-containing protein [Terriglobales bacterium]|nr:FtsQ-type POTRA domain-containing protein [Terriglobales bacterium]